MAAVNAYSAPRGNTIYGTDNNGNSKVKSDNNLDMDDFLNLLTAQLANQDVMNPSSDTDFIAQMAQFSSLQAMKTLTELSMAQHGSSMIGKYVVVAHLDERGKLVEDKGLVTNVKFMGGVVSLTVNDKEYEMSSVMEVITKEEFEKPPKVDTDKDGITDDKDDDIDGDKIPNDTDDDVDGDGILNDDDKDYVKPPAEDEKTGKQA